MTKRILTYYLIVVSFIFVAKTSVGQNVKPPHLIREEVKSLFDKRVKNVWIILSSGKLDDMHVVDMAFGTDGYHVKGFYYLRSSGERFELDGFERDHKYTLVETTKRGKTTGYIFGHFDGNAFTGEWLDADKKHTLTFETKVLASFDQYQPVLCDHKIWHGYYTGKIEKTPCSIFLCKSDQQMGFCCKSEDTFVFDTLHQSGKSRVYTVQLSPTQKAIIDLDSPEYIVVESSQDFQNYLLKVSTMVHFQCFEFANFTTRIETIRPVLENKKFNTWLDETLSKWHDHSYKKLTLTTEESNANHHRYKDIGYGWVEISYLSDEYISGHIFMQSSWKKGTDKISFMYDLKKSRHIESQDIWNETLLTPAKIDSLCQSGKKQVFSTDQKINQWISGQNFQHLTFKEKGLSFQTPFSNIYGEYEFIIPYETLKPHLKNKSFLKNF